jgi:hypothetical protein
MKPKHVFDPIVGNWPDRDWFSVPLLSGKWGLPLNYLYNEVKAARLVAYKIGPRGLRVTLANAMAYEQSFIANQ